MAAVIVYAGQFSGGDKPPVQAPTCSVKLRLYPACKRQNVKKIAQFRSRSMALTLSTLRLKGGLEGLETVRL